MVNRVVPVVLVTLFLVLSMILGVGDVFDRNSVIGLQFFIIGGGLLLKFCPVCIGSRIHYISCMEFLFFYSFSALE